MHSHHPITSHLVKIYHSFDKGRGYFRDFLASIGRTLEGERLVFGLHCQHGEIFYSFSADTKTYLSFESQFYSHFDSFQMSDDTKHVWDFDASRTVIGEVHLENRWFFPFRTASGDDTTFVFNLFRTMENFDVTSDRMGFFVDVCPISEESAWFYVRAKLSFFLFRIILFFRMFRYMFNFRIDRNWKHEGHKFFREKMHHELFATRIYIVSQSRDKSMAEARIRSVFNHFGVFRDYPHNQFDVHIHHEWKDIKNLPYRRDALTADEISNFFQFPKDPKNETSLLKVKSKKLAIPIGVQTMDYTRSDRGEIIPERSDPRVNVLGISDYRSVRVPIGIYDEDRLRHIYVIGKTGVGKSKFFLGLMRDDILNGRGFAVIDPHGDMAEEVMMHMTEDRIKDIIIFDPTDSKFPFCFNPLDVSKTESKQILAKGFIDIFRKFFGANWNPKLEHVLRMVFLALLDKPDSTVFDIIRALTDKDFRYQMIETVQDDVVRNFWTNEFAGWSSQFNTEAIMPILNKVGQLLSIEMIRNIFASSENRLDFRQVMDEGKILIVKLPKGKLQEEIMGFLGAMFVTKLFQAAMGRQSLSLKDRRPFFLYVDEFQNFATDTFNEILSEARKYGLGLAVAHQFLRQIPAHISDALFGNVGTMVIFRVSSEDALQLKQYFDPFLGAYDLSNLDVRELYCRTLVRGGVKDPLSLQTAYCPDATISREGIEYLYSVSRKKYCRSLTEVQATIVAQKDVIEKLDTFHEPLI